MMPVRLFKELAEPHLLNGCRLPRGWWLDANKSQSAVSQLVDRDWPMAVAAWDWWHLVHAQFDYAPAIQCSVPMLTSLGSCSAKEVPLAGILIWLARQLRPFFLSSPFPVALMFFLRLRFKSAQDGFS